MLSIAGATYSFMWHETLKSGLQKYSQIGLSRMELTVSLPHTDMSRGIQTLAAEINDIARSTNIGFTSLNPVELNLISASSELARTSLEQYKSAIDLAAEVGAPIVTVIPGRLSSLCPMDSQYALDSFARAMDELVPHAEKAGVKIALENTPFGFLQYPKELFEHVQSYGSAALGLVFDAANLHFLDGNIGEELKYVASKVLIAHISDTSIGKFTHAYVGQGSVNFKHFVDVLLALDTPVELVYELVTPKLDWDRVAQDIRELQKLGNS